MAKTIIRLLKSLYYLVLLNLLNLLLFLKLVFNKKLLKDLLKALLEFKSIAVSHGLGTCAVLSPTGLALGIQASLPFYNECIQGSYTT
jgi:hypothetical protein